MLKSVTQPNQRTVGLLMLTLAMLLIASHPATAQSEFAGLRQTTAPFHSIDVAKASGWGTLITPCMESPEGGMGYHYGNLNLLGDADLDPMRPEILLYEPTKNGSLRLVAMEYIILEDFLPRTAEAPEVLGQHLHFDAVNGVWALHVWAWRQNPNGMFADWNPRVSCQYAD